MLFYVLPFIKVDNFCFYLKMTLKFHYGGILMPFFKINLLYHIDRVIVVYKVFIDGN